MNPKERLMEVVDKIRLTLEILVMRWIHFVQVEEVVGKCQKLVELSVALVDHGVD